MQVEPLKARPNVEVLAQPGLATAYLCFNTQRPPFNDARVRKAVAAAIDRGRIVELNYKGYGKVAASLVPPIMFGSYPVLARVGSAPDEAMALLEDASMRGLRCTLWAMPNPRPYMPEPKKVAEVIAEDLAVIGVRPEIVTYPWDVYLAKCRAGEFDMCLMGWTADVNDPDNFLGVLLESANVGGSNFSRYSDPEYDALLAQARSVMDSGERSKLYRRAQEKLARDMPVFPLVHADQLAAYRKDLEGFVLMPTGSPYFANARLRKP